MRRRRPPSAFDIFGITARRRRERWQRMRVPLAFLSGAALVGAVVGVAPAITPAAAPGASAVAGYGEPLSDCSVTDGDTIRCGDERIRLLGIDAPELPGHCRRGRICAPGDPYASAASLGEALRGPLTIDRAGKDRYGRTLARVAGANGDLSCLQLARGHAIYIRKWDDGSRVARTCPGAVM